MAGIDWSATGLSSAAAAALRREAQDHATQVARAAGREADTAEMRLPFHRWANQRTEAIYPSPKEHRTPPELSTAWVHVTFSLGYLVFLILLGTVKSLRDAGSGVFFILVAFIVLWVVVAKSVASGNKARLARWWAEYDPHNGVRWPLYKALNATLTVTFEREHEEYYRPVSSVPAPEVDAHPREGLKWTPRGVRPKPMGSCTDRQAEFLAKRWMEFLGEDRCIVSAATRDGGADVVSPRFMAEVKHHASVIPPAMVRAVVGVAHVAGKSGLFFARTGYTEASVEFADRAGAALFVYDYARGTLTGRSVAARKALAEGLPAIAPDV